MSPGVKDRFKELSEAQGNTSVAIDDENEVPPQFREVFQKVYEIRNWIGNIKENTRKIKESVQSNTTFASKSTYDEIENRVNDTYNIAFKVTHELKKLEVTGKHKDDGSDKSTLARVKKIQYGSLRQDFQNALFESNQFLEKYKEQKRIILRKQALLVQANLQDEDLEKLLDNSESINLFTDNILLHTRVAKEELSLIEERHSELLKIENMIMEVNKQFKTIAVMVEQQKDHINRIEFHAADAIDYVDQGRKELNKAEINKKKARMKMYIITVIILVIIGVLLVIFL